MIRARHSSLFASLFARYARWLLRREFQGVYVKGSLPRTRAPLLVAVQHVGWWDPIVLFYLSRVRFDGTHYVMMDEANLERLGFFRWLGAFGIDRSSPAGTRRPLRYALARLREPWSRVWVFPQGDLAPVDQRPLRCAPGAAWLAARSRTPAVAVAIRYEFGEPQHPRLFVSFGDPHLVEEPHDPDVVDPIEAMLTAQADALREDVYASRLSEFDQVLRGRRSISDIFAPSQSA